MCFLCVPGIFFAVGVYAARGAAVPSVFQTLVSPAIRSGESPWLVACVSNSLILRMRAGLYLTP